MLSRRGAESARLVRLGCTCLGCDRGQSHRVCTERGAAALEFALVIPILIVLLFGVTTTGLAYSDHVSVSNAVREGARLGSAIDYNTSPSGWADSVQTRVQQVYMNAGASFEKEQICVLLVSGATTLASPTQQGTCGAVPSSPNAAGGNCIVKVWADKPAKISLIAVPDLNFSIGARSVSYYGRTVGACTAP